MTIGERASKVITRLAVGLFSLSVALFDQSLLMWLVRMKQRARTLLNGGQPGAATQPVAEEPVATTTGPESVVFTRGPEAVAGPMAASRRQPVPVVFVHQGNSPHLSYALAQARKSNPDSTVILLGDEANSSYAGIEHHYLKDYFQGAAEFEKVYRHLSTHAVSFELICFQRWFILAEFLRAHDRSQCVYLDSDVLLYADVTKEMEKFRQFEFTLCWNTIGCTFFLNHLDGLERFCRFTMDVYAKRDRYHYDQMIAKFAIRQRNHLPGGASDMTALELYEELHFGRVGEASVVIDGSIYDPNINMPHPGFEMENNVKRIEWKDGFPYGTLMRTGEKVRFNSLHFNGGAKSMMRACCTADLD